MNNMSKVTSLLLDVMLVLQVVVGPHTAMSVPRSSLSRSQGVDDFKEALTKFGIGRDLTISGKDYMPIKYEKDMNAGDDNDNLESRRVICLAQSFNSNSDQQVCTGRDGGKLYEVISDTYEDITPDGMLIGSATSGQALSLMQAQPMPMPNIDKLGSGYDILFANPHAIGSIDPGFRDSVYDLSVYSGKLTPDQRFAVPDGTQVSLI
jgi:hypothetical protein